jgi:hypothetical protein
VLWAAGAGALAGLLLGAAGAWLVLGDPGPGRGRPGTLRGDLDRLTARQGLLVAASEGADRGLLARVEALERSVLGLDADVARHAEVAQALEALSQDLRTLRAAYEDELSVVDARLEQLGRRLEELSVAAGLLRVGTGAALPASDEEEGMWVNLARDADPNRRFSALVKLGRRKTDRSVAVSLEALNDAEPTVVRQAARNLGQFRELSAAARLAWLLGNPDVGVRQAAYDALRDLGAPDSGYVPTAPAEDRADPAAHLRAWASEVR